MRPTEFDDLNNGQQYHIVLADCDAELIGRYIEYQRVNGLHLMSFAVLMDGSETKMFFETVDIAALFAVERPPVAEASTDFEPDDLGGDYPC